ncbi:Abi family protein, partial [uncultured Varibaculum sp.]|uniref:Abi family protein n=1 Tax=uncultured Varibaculum sp. TaxID=413896 RepID=UPI00288A922A
MPQSLDAPLAKQFKTHGEQIALLRKRGMLIESDSEACRLLEQVNYYRLSGYWYSWRKLLEPGKRADSFISGTTLVDVAAVYMFDCKLRETVFACLAPIELSVRSMLGHELGRIDTFAHLHPNVLGPLAQASDGEGSSAGYQKWLARYEKELRASREDFVAHHNKKYGGRLPIWAAVEV